MSPLEGLNVKLKHVLKRSPYYLFSHVGAAAK